VLAAPSEAAPGEGRRRGGRVEEGDVAE